MISVAMTSDEIQGNDAITFFYLQQYFSVLGTVLPKSFTGAFSSNCCLYVREV